MSQAKFGIAIVADDQTAKGAKSAEKRLANVGKNAKHYSSVAERAASRLSGTSGFGGLVGTMGKVERATARAFGVSSPLGNALGRLESIGSAGSAVASGLGEAAAGAGIFRTALAATATVAGVTIGLFGAAAYAGVKFGDNWAKSAANIGRTAAIMGVATDTLQKFTAASERVGVSKEAAAATLGSLSSTLNDARYGRNGAAIGVLSKLRVPMALNKDGTVDVGAMLPTIADAITRQNSAGKRTAAGALGISLDALAAFMQGGKALSADMADAGTSSYIASASAIAMGKRVQRKSAMLSQLKDAALGWGGERAARLTEGADDLGNNAGRSIAAGTFSSVVHDSFAPAAKTIDRAATTMYNAASVIGRGIIGRADAGTPLNRPRSFTATSSVVGGIRGAARRFGVDESMMLAIAAQESGFDPSNWPGKKGGRPYGWKGQHALGLFQFLPQTWLGAIKQHGAELGLGHVASWITGRPGHYTMSNQKLLSDTLALRTDPSASAAFAAALMRDAAPGVARAAGHDQATAGDLYAQHFLGPSGAQRFFRMERARPNMSAAAALPVEASAPGNAGLFYGANGRQNSLEQLLQILIQKASQPLQLHVTTDRPATKVKVGRGNAVAISHSFPDF